MLYHNIYCYPYEVVYNAYTLDLASSVKVATRNLIYRWRKRVVSVLCHYVHTSSPKGHVYMWLSFFPLKICAVMMNEPSAPTLCPLPFATGRDWGERVIIQRWRRRRQLRQRALFLGRAPLPLIILIFERFMYVQLLNCGLCFGLFGFSLNLITENHRFICFSVKISKSSSRFPL